MVQPSTADCEMVGSNPKSLPERYTITKVQHSFRKFIAKTSFRICILPKKGKIHFVFSSETFDSQVKVIIYAPLARHGGKG